MTYKRIIVRTVEHRDQLLLSLYEKRNFWLFVGAIEQFNHKAEEIHNSWINDHNSVNYANVMCVERKCWEDAYTDIWKEEA